MSVDIEVADAPESTLNGMAAAPVNHARATDPTPCVEACHRTVIEPSPGWRAVNLVELWRYRELLGLLAIRDIKVRYKQTAFGAAWAIVPPLTTMLIFNLLFTLMGRKPSGALPYTVATFAALLPWQLFASVMSQSGSSLVNNGHLISKVYFPRLIIPISAVLSALVDFAIASLLLVAMMAWHGIVPGIEIATLPAFILLAVIAALGVGLWLSALSVQFRDVKYVIPFVAQLGMYVTPVLYTTAAVIPESWRPIYGLNPMAGVVEGFRWALFGDATGLGPWIAGSIVATLLFFTGGLFYFRRMEQTFADLA